MIQIGLVVLLCLLKKLDTNLYRFGHVKQPSPARTNGNGERAAGAMMILKLNLNLNLNLHLNRNLNLNLNLTYVAYPVVTVTNALNFIHTLCSHLAGLQGIFSSYHNVNKIVLLYLWSSFVNLIKKIKIRSLHSMNNFYLYFMMTYNFSLAFVTYILNNVYFQIHKMLKKIRLNSRN